MSNSASPKSSNKRGILLTATGPCGPVFVWLYSIEHDLRANAFRVCREGKPVPTFPDHALRRSQHWRRGGRPDHCERNLDNSCREPDGDADAPGHVVGAERVVDQPAAIGAEEAAELVAHEGKALDHRLPLQPEH